MSTVNTEKPQIRAGCYCRISSDPDDRREGVQRQRKDTAALCEVKGWTPVDYYVDNDRSASNGKERPEWDRLLADIKAGEVDAIAAWDQDRGWRLMGELEELRRFFKSLGRRVPLATTGQGDVDLYSPTGVLAAQIKTAVSEHEVAMLKVRIRRAAREKADKGLPQWKQAFGYLPETRRKADDDGTRELDPKVAPLVEQAYKAILAGASLNDVGRLFNDAGAYGLNGQRWRASTVSMFLRKPRNAGLRAHNGEIIGQGTWPPLVSESVWRAVQAKIDAPGRAPGRKSVRQHLLTGILQCGKCGGGLSGYVSRDEVRAYRCKTCFGLSVRSQQVEPVVYDLIGGRLAMKDAVDLLRADMDEAEAGAIRAELSQLYGELEKIAVERGKRWITPDQARISTACVMEDIEKLERRQNDSERVRVLEGLPLGTPEVVAAVKALTPDRFRAVASLLVVGIPVAPVGKGHRADDGGRFDSTRVDVVWRNGANPT